MKRLPVNEMFYLPTRDYSYEISHAKHERVKEILLAILLILFVLAFIADNLLGMTSIARAETKPVIHQNDYYCHLIANGEGVVGADSEEIKSVCDKYK